MAHRTIKQICVASVIAALYVVLTWAVMPLAFGPIQIRPAEAFTILPLLFPEAVVGLFVGCLIANTVSMFGVMDILLGSMLTLLAAFITKLSKNVWLGGLAPVLLNAFGLPLLWLLFASDINYWVNVLSIFLSQAFVVYLLGVPLYFGVRKLSLKHL